MTNISADRLEHIRSITVKGGVSAQQWALALSGVTATVAGGVVNPIATLTAFVTSGIFGFAGTTGYKLYAAARSGEGWVETPPHLSDEELPAYTVLIPVCDEPDMITQLLEHMEAINYPRHKLRVRLLLEEWDKKTRAAADAVRFPVWFQKVVVKNSYRPGIKGKPRALMYAVENGWVESPFVTVYDAEDQPEPNQLKDAATIFHYHPELSAIQARLQWENADQNYYTRMVAGCYAFSWELLFPGSVAVGGLPPFGGTSQHLRVAHAALVNWWDVTNVTEDVGLAASMIRAGMRFAMFDSTTWETATYTWKSQVKQQSRWIKGHTATFLAHSRNIPALLRDLGWSGTLGFLTTVAASHISVLAAIGFWGLTLIYLGFHATVALSTTGLPYLSYLATLLLHYLPLGAGAGLVQQITLQIAFYVGSICLIMNVIFSWLTMVSLIKSRQYRLVLWMLLLPVYWLHVVTPAAIKAAVEMPTRMLYWDKTAHVPKKLEVVPVTLVIGEVSIEGND